MAKEEKKGGFFASFRKGIASGNEGSPSTQAVPSVGQAKSRNAAVTEPRVPSVTVEQSKPAIVSKAVSAPENSASAIDTVANFNFLCQSLVDIGASQLKVVEMTLTMIAKSLNKIAEGFKAK